MVAKGLRKYITRSCSGTRFCLGRFIFTYDNFSKLGKVNIKVSALIRALRITSPILKCAIFQHILANIARLPYSKLKYTIAVLCQSSGGAS
jgi:hypothetical protein